MRSPGTRRLPRLATRVALGGMLAATAGGTLAALVAGLTAGSLVIAHDDRELLRAATELADELTEEQIERPEDDTPEEHLHFARTHGARTLPNLILHELEDVKLPRPTAATFRDGRRIGGDPSLPSLLPGACTQVVEPGVPRRACAVAFEGGTLTLARSGDEDRERRLIFLRSIAIGGLVGALAGGVGGLAVARWTLAPVEGLRERVRDVRLDAPSAAALSAPESYEELEELRAALAELIERLAEALGHARAFAAQAAHELRTPLAAIAADLDLLAETGDRLGHARVRRQVEDLTALVQRLLALATPAPDGGVEGFAVDLSDLIADEVARLTPTEAGRVISETEPDVLVRGDDSLLAALLGNAVDNALKFSDGPVRVRASAVGDEAWLEVVDEGPGIPDAERDRVFAVFYRARDARIRGRPGHGVGLALIAHVARAHGGHVEWVDAPTGLHLRIRLPRWTVPEA